MCRPVSVICASERGTHESTQILTRGHVERDLGGGYQVVLDSTVQVSKRRQGGGPHPYHEVLVGDTIDGAYHLQN